jgi:hypothetical protein
MVETVESLAERLTKVEKTLTEVTLQLSLLIEELARYRQKADETSVEVGKPVYTDKREASAILRPFFERLGIADLNPISIEELHKSMERNGLSAEKNEFSRAIIEEREK